MDNEQRFIWKLVATLVGLIAFVTIACGYVEMNKARLNCLGLSKDATLCR